ncbi:MBL fold metallo-hydrolase [Streptomyces sp. TBY4]|uniref:MBL fold metallo-hydrolase n=1 Tax=Streptomyces sp. TBY4 TaxID=2962030 RepID=UPI0020B7C7EC|nr:MBL fold metallo-hydrolase [Streptomyces sp. TBY4]MCP3759699.1 MBL fold metallo-hydrolase [Streptomyces sp. TBY4]
MPQTTSSSLQYDTLCMRRPGLTRDLPPGAEDLQWVANTATLIFGNHDAVLVDTFLTVEQNQQLVDWVKAHHRNLTYIYITHGHGDHAFGVKQLIEAFPEAKAISAAAVVAKAKHEGTRPFLDTFWTARFPGQIPQPQVFPEALDSDTFTLEGHPLQVIDTGYTDTDDSTALWVPDLRLVVAGDVAYNGIHQYMGEATAESRQEWMRATDTLAALDPAFVVAGHKNPDLTDDPKILAETKQYLADFNRLDPETETPSELYEAMLALYPNRANPGSLWGGAKRAKGSAQ